MSLGNNILVVSSELFNRIAEFPKETEVAKFIACGIEVRVSYALPYQQTYKACDMETREEICVAGDIINAILAPKMDFKDLIPFTGGISQLFILPNDNEPCA